MMTKPSHNLTPEQRMQQAVALAFSEINDESATLEALLPRVSRALRRVVTHKQLEQFLNKYPTSYRQSQNGRWELVNKAWSSKIRSAHDEDEKHENQSKVENIGINVAGSFVVFDLETMGNWNGPDQASDIEIIQIAAQRYEQFCPVGDSFVSFIKPSGPIPARITHLTRISMDDVLEAPDIKSVLDQFFTYTRNLPLIAHNGALFDGPVLRRVIERINYQLNSPFLILDTLPLARALLPIGVRSPFDATYVLENHKLTSLATFYNCFEDGAHRADIDVLMLGGVINGLRNELISTDYSPAYHAAASYCLALLARANDPWVNMLGGTAPSYSLDDLPHLFSLFGRSAIPLLPLSEQLGEAGPTSQAIEEILRAYERLGGERRDAQSRLAQTAGQAFREQKIALIEAGTGTGKGLGYLAPAYLHSRISGTPVVVSTFTRVLQDQLYRSDLQFLHQAVDGKLTTALLKGQRNYMSSRCLAEEIQDAFEEDKLDPTRAWALVTLISFALFTIDGDLSPIRSLFSGFEHLIRAHQQIFMLYDRNISQTSPSTRYMDVWNILERVRVTSEVAQAAWPVGLPRQHDYPDFYLRAKINAQRANILVVNHSLLLMKALREPVEQKESTDEADIQLRGLFSTHLIFDEAHTLEDAATSALTRNITYRQILRLLSAIIGFSGAQGGALGGLVRSCRLLGIAQDDPALERITNISVALVSQLDALGQQLHRFIDRNIVVKPEDRQRYGISLQLTRQSLVSAGGPILNQVGRQFMSQLMDLYLSIDELSSSIYQQSKYATDQISSRRVSRAERMRISIAEELREVSLDTHWFWNFFDDHSMVRVVRFEPGSSGDHAWSLSGLPIGVGALLHDRLWSRVHAAVITSATITNYGGSFEFFIQRTGLSRVSSEKLLFELLPHVFDYREHALFLMPNHLPAPRDNALQKEYPEAVSVELQRFIPFSGGRVLVLFTARSRMEYVHEKIVGPLDAQGLPVLVQDEAEAIERFKADEQISLLGVRSLWEGVNVPGPSLSYVLIEKFPFPSIGDPLEAARIAAIDRVGGDSFYEYILPRAIFQFKQGFGRLNRSRSDHGVVIMLDKRLRSAMYRGEVLQSLPHPTIEYVSEIGMYQRVSEWMNLPFDEQSLFSRLSNHVEQVLFNNQLSSSIVDEQTWNSVALPSLNAVLKGIWGDRQLFTFQIDAMHAVLTGRDVLTLAPTGSGKSLTYQLPALIRPGCTLVISPLIALIRDQVTTLREHYGLSGVNCLVSGMSQAEQEEVMFEARNGNIKILYLSPERLRDPRFRSILTQIPIVQIVVDEAHCISTWGHDFRPDFLEIPNLLEIETAKNKRINIHALTATATPQVQEEIKQALRFSQRVTLDGELLDPLVHLNQQRRQNIVYRLYHCANAEECEARTIEMVKQMVACHDLDGPGIVYVATRAKAEHLAELLRERNISARAYHGGLRTAERHMIQELFMDGSLNVVCCTNAFGMGVDKPNIRFVLHYDHPSSVEAYAQETGRAGRDGKKAYAVLLYSSSAQRTHRFIARKNIEKKEEFIPLLSLLKELQKQSPLVERRVMTSFEFLADELSLEDTAVRVLIYGAEQIGLIKRLPDVVLEASILLGKDISTLIMALPEHKQAQARRLLEYLVRKNTSSLNGKALEEILAQEVGGIRLQYTARDWITAGGDPQKATELLQQLSELFPIHFIFRPYARGLFLDVAAISSEDLPNVSSRLDTYFLERYEHFEERLKAMLDYIALSKERCRVVYLQNYLLGTTDMTPCGMCDLCSPHLSLPWNDQVVEANIQRRTISEKTVLAETIAFSILEAVRDHAGYFGLNTIIKMLLGQAFGQTQVGKPYSLPIVARNSEHFGSLRTMGVKENRIRALISQLLEKNYLTNITKVKKNPSMEDAVTFDSLDLTLLGKDVLAGERDFVLDGDQK